MAWTNRKAKQDIAPYGDKLPDDVGSNNINSREDDYGDESYAETQYYPGFLPQVYSRPGQVWTSEGVKMSEDEFGSPIDTAGSGVNIHRIFNVNRGTESHGVDDLTESTIHDKDVASPGLTHGFVQQVVPELKHEDIHDAVRVKVVGDPIEDVNTVINTYSVTGNQIAVRILGKDRHRTKAIVGTSGTPTGTPVIVANQNGNPAYGFPIPGALVAPLVINSTNELWVMGSAPGDSFVVAVLQERKINADKNHPV